MQRRKSIEVEGLNHHGKLPVPMGAKVDRFIFSSAIAGVDPETGKIPADPTQQVKLVFQNVHRFMEEAGGTTEDIGRVALYLQDEELRDLVNEEWVKMFPDPGSRPARHATVKELRAGALVQLEITAVLRGES